MFLIKSEVTQVIISKRSFLFMFFHTNLSFILIFESPNSTALCKQKSSTNVKRVTLPSYAFGPSLDFLWEAVAMELVSWSCTSKRVQEIQDNMLQRLRSCNSTTLTLLGHFFCGAKKNGLQRSGKMFDLWFDIFWNLERTALREISWNFWVPLSSQLDRRVDMSTGPSHTWRVAPASD